MPHTAPFLLDTTASPQARTRFAPVDCWKPAGPFWTTLCRENLRTMLLEEYRQILETSRLENFRAASGRSNSPFTGIYFNDSDVYKWLEAAAWFSMADTDGEVVRAMENCVDEIIAAQQPDGYLNSYFTTGGREAERWSSLGEKHQLYCAGHFFQAAVAHHRSTGSARLLDAARRFADCICLHFGPAVEGKTAETDGHPEIELALVELYRATGEKKYLRQAEFFLDIRGQNRVADAENLLQHAPYREIQEMTGHAVRALYLAAGATDVVLENGDPTLLSAIRAQWRNFQTKKRYVTGGAGSRWRGEEFGDDYELPHRGYCETCAAIASMMWSQRLFALEADPAFMDSLEWTFFNAVLPGVSRNGTEFFYENLLVDNGRHRRKKWFGCACCPPNIARLLASLPGYAFGISDTTVWIHLPMSGAITLPLPGGQTAGLEISGTYPWGGEIRIKTTGHFSGTLAVRIPSWCGAAPVVVLNGETRSGSAEPGSYFKIQREWRPGDCLQISLDDAPRLIEPHPHILDSHHLVAVARGPLLYCTEAAYNPHTDLRHVELLAGAVPALAGDASLPPDACALSWPAQYSPPGGEWDGQLYRTRKAGASAKGEVRNVTLTPYFYWGNREPGRMQVWQKFIP